MGLRSFLVAAVVGVVAPLNAAEPSATKLDEFLQGLQTLEAQFKQTLRDGQGTVIETSQGTLAIHRPDRFRWDYAAPHEQVIVADGKQLWLYDVELEQVTVRPMAQTLVGTPASLLSGKDDLRANFKVAKVENVRNASALTLTPNRDDTDFKQVRIRFEGKALDSMELTDKLGQSTLLEFVNVKRNGAIDAARFAFTPPAGVDVIGVAQ